jgi:hypothetical protein
VKVDVNPSWGFLPNARNLGLVCKPCLGLDSLMMTKNVPVNFGFLFRFRRNIIKINNVSLHVNYDCVFFSSVQKQSVNRIYVDASLMPCHPFVAASYIV